MKTTQLLYCLLFVTFVSNAKAQNAIVSSGGNASGSGGSASYSVGQLVYTNASGTNGSVSEGIQQPIEILTLGIDNFPDISLGITVYPNPATSSVILKSGNTKLENAEYLLFDMNGKQIAHQNITNSETRISMKNLKVAIYFLHVMNGNKVLKTFKIIKNG